MRKLLLLGVSLFLVCSASFAQNERKVALLDLTQRNNESNLSRYWSAKRICDLGGFAYDTTTNLSNALTYPVVLFATRVQASTFDLAEKQQIKDYVNNGGVVIISSLRDGDLFDMAGVSNAESENTLYKLTWDVQNQPDLFYMINDSLEKTISLGRPSSGPTFYTRHYTLNGGEALARYENDSIASVYNEYGNGFCYTFGPDFREMIYRNQIDADVGAHRTYSNGFEPTSDVVCFWVRNIVRKHIPQVVYKYTVPSNANSVMLITHDLDSRTAMDTMQYFSDYELERGIVGTYNITTRYFNDALMSNFYVGTSNLLTEVLNDGHTLASHSVGHFPDYADDNLFPYGTLGNTFANYHPEHFSGASTGGTVLGELEVSKGLIELDHNVNVRSFRAGHLAYPKLLGMALEETGYEFNSTHSSNNVLTNYPYYIPASQSFTTTMTNVLEIPMTISDVFASDPINSDNFHEKVDAWVSATNKYDENHSAINLLIHPNRQYKLQAQINYVNSLPAGCVPYEFEKYGEFWRKRDSLRFESTLESDTLKVYFLNDCWNTDQGFVIDDSNLAKIQFFDVNDNEVFFDTKEQDDGLTLYFSGDPLVSVDDEYVSLTEKERIRLFPNPATDELNLMFSDVKTRTIRIFDLNGKEVFKRISNQSVMNISLSGLNLENGLYLVDIRSKNSYNMHKFVKQ